MNETYEPLAINTLVVAGGTLGIIVSDPHWPHDPYSVEYDVELEEYVEQDPDEEYRWYDVLILGTDFVRTVQRQDIDDVSQWVELHRDVRVAA